MTTTTYPSNLFDVTLTYAEHIPEYKGRVPAYDIEHAKRIAHYDAMNKGWPRDYTSADAQQLES